MKRLFAGLFSLLVCLTCMAPTTVTKPTHITIVTVGGACPVTAGTLTLRVAPTRSNGISPLLVFYDATATTDSTVSPGMVPFQDVTFTWNFGDGGTSGTSTWAYGANPGVNSRNAATGGIAAHLYVTQGNDTAYVATVTATDGSNTASCTVPVTAFDPANGFPGAATTCLFNATVGTGCPSGATQTTASTTAAINTSISNKRLLYKCGDSFSGDNVNVQGTKWSIGAYGACVGTTAGRPQFTDGSSANPILGVSPNAIDGRIADIDFEGSGGGAATAVYSFLNVLSGTVDVSQLTVYNVNSTGNKANFFIGQGNQVGFIASTAAATGGSGISTFTNGNQNNCANASTAYQCGQGAGAVYININYHAYLGNSLAGVGGPGGNNETLRFGACRFCVVENNFLNSPIAAAASLKVTSANTYNTLNGWMGQYTEYFEISDNLIGTITASAPTGGSPFEVAPENPTVDERIRYVVMERNVISAATASTNTRLGMFTGQNMTFRDNACYFVTAGGFFAQTCNQFGNRGTGTNGGLTPGAGSFLAMNLEGYNNTCYATTSHAGQNCLENDTVGGFSPATSSVFQNNLLYVSSGSFSTIVDTGGNTVSNNTVTTTNNPGFTNASGTFLLMSDWKPTANFSGAISVPVIYDGLNILWGPTPDLGAVKH